MKYTVLTLLTFAAFASNAQKVESKDVPEAVKSAFAMKFPAAKSVKWSKESADEFEAEFKNGATEQSSNFDGSGKWIVTETEIKTSQLPAAVQATLKSEYKDYKVEEAEKVEDNASQTFYEVELEKDESNLEVKFSSDGKTMRKEETKEIEHEG